jgi:hypothetical protein
VVCTPWEGRVQGVNATLLRSGVSYDVGRKS